MQKTVISLFRSEALKQKIAEVGHTFSELELLKIIHEYAPTWDERLRLMDVFSRAPQTSPETAAFIAEYMAWQRRLLKYMQTAEDDTVYELHIKTNPRAYDERYLCATYAAALKYIDMFYEEYGKFETDHPLARYTIVKRRIYTGAVSQPFDEDWLGECELGFGKTLLRVNCEEEGAEKLSYGCEDGDCDTCRELCLKGNAPRFPRFWHDKQLVRYTDGDGSTQFGICRVFEPDVDMYEDVYVIPLEYYAIYYRRYEDLNGGHRHIAPPLVEPASLDEPDEETKQNCLAFLEYLSQEDLRTAQE